MSSTPVPNGNICLTFDASVSRLLTKFAAKYFADKADGYLLGPAALPHITLSHIHHDRPQPRALRRDLSAIKTAPDSLTLNGLTQRAGAGPHAGHIWLEFSLTPAPEWLTALKDEADAILRKYDISILTPAGPGYHPHLTICRMKPPQKPVVTDALNFKTTITAEQFQLSLGQSDANGQFQKIFWGKSLACA